MLTTKQIKDSLARVKVYYQRNEIKRALEAIIYALENAGNTENTDIRSALRETTQLMSRDEQVKRFSPSPLLYQPGSENLLLKQFANIYQKIKESELNVSHQQSLERKISMDKSLNEGIKALQNKNSTEADGHFMRALTFYINEHYLFYMIASALREAGEIRRAYPYAKRGVAAVPNSKKYLLLLQEIETARNALT